MDRQPLNLHTYPTLGLRRIRARMAWLGVTQQQVAEQLDVDSSFFSRLLRRGAPPPVFLWELAKALGWDDVRAILEGPDELVVLTEPPDWVRSPHLSLDHASVLDKQGQQAIPWSARSQVDSA